MTHIKRLFWVSLGVKLILSAILPLTNDEAYYWVWSRDLQLSYYDHPPFVAWLFWLGDFTAWFPGSVRWPGVLLGHASLAIGLLTLKPYLDEGQRTMWLWLMLLSPLVGGSALVLTPDLPLMFFYALSLFVFLRWLKEGDGRWALAFGLSLGLGFSSKYMMVLFPLSLVPVMIFSPALRKTLVKNLPWVVLGGVLGSAPVWMWNIMNDFASIRFQAAHGLGRAWKPWWTVHYVLAQIGLVFPIVLYWAVRARGRLPFVFHCLAWTPLVFFFFTTFRGYVEANWPIAAYPAIFVLAVSAYPKNIRGLQATLVTWGTLLAALAVVVIAQPDWSRAMKFREFHQFDEVIETARRQNLSPLFARSYQMAAKMHFELQRPVHKLRGMNRRDYYDFRSESQPANAQSYYLAVEKGDHLPPVYRTRGHQVIEKIPVDNVYEIWKVQAP